MLKETEKTMRQYLKEIKLLLPIHGKEERKFLKDYKTSLKAFLTDRPACTPEEFRDHFESPEDVAYNYISSLDQQQLCKRITFRRTIVRIFLCVCAIALICWLVMLWNIYTYEQSQVISQEVIVIE